MIAIANKLKNLVQQLLPGVHYSKDILLAGCWLLEPIIPIIPHFGHMIDRTRAYGSFCVVQPNAPSKTTLGQQSELRSDQLIDLYGSVIFFMEGQMREDCTSLGTRCIGKELLGLIGCE